MNGTARFLALGDSYTIGEGVEPSECWPAQLASLLRARGVAVDGPEVIAVSGWTTRELAEGIGRAQPGGVYSLVSLLIGANNQFRGLGLSEYRKEVRALLQQAIAFGGDEAGRVLVLSIPDWGVTPYAVERDRAKVAREIDAFNDVNSKETELLGARYVDITALSRVAGYAAMVVADGLHPSGDMYRLWAERALPQAELAIAR